MGVDLLVNSSVCPSHSWKQLSIMRQGIVVRVAGQHAMHNRASLRRPIFSVVTKAVYPEAEALVRDRGTSVRG